jgi:hypothetical protein
MEIEMNCIYCGDDGCEECSVGAREISRESERNIKEYKMVSIRIKEMYEDLISGEGVTECFEQLIKEMKAFNKGDFREFEKLIKNHYTER